MAMADMGLQRAGRPHLGEQLLDKPRRLSELPPKSILGYDGVGSHGPPSFRQRRRPLHLSPLEMFRDGMEDYEYFVILKKLLAAKGDTLLPTKRAEYEALLKVPAAVSASLTQFTTSPETLEWHRAKLAKAIAELQ